MSTFSLKQRALPFRPLPRLGKLYRPEEANEFAAETERQLKQLSERASSRLIYEGWFQNDVPAGQGNTAMARYTTGAALFPNEVFVLRPCSVTLIFIAVDQTVTTGTVSVGLSKNGVIMGFGAGVNNTTGRLWNVDQLEPGELVLAPGDRIGVMCSSTGLAPANVIDVRAAVELVDTM